MTTVPTACQAAEGERAAAGICWAAARAGTASDVSKAEYGVELQVGGEEQRFEEQTAELQRLKEAPSKARHTTATAAKARNRKSAPFLGGP